VAIATNITHQLKFIQVYFAAEDKSEELLRERQKAKKSIPAGI